MTEDTKDIVLIALEDYRNALTTIRDHPHATEDERAWATEDLTELDAAVREVEAMEVSR